MVSDLRSKLEMYKMNQKSPSREEKTAKGPDVHELVKGRVHTDDAGSFYFIEKRYPLSHLHAGCILGKAKESTLEPLLKACSGKGLPLGLQDFAFLDTETTGLSGGTGTVAFLLGVGFFEEDCFVLHQYFMRDYDEEYPMLKTLNGLLSSYKGLVTFNGKAFDWNLINTRLSFSRLRPGLKEPLHVDLLYPSRVLWRRKLQSCSLSSLEENVLGMSRVDDIPGALIPGIYFKYLGDRNAEDIKKVITHNEKDILSMVSLMVRICSILDSPLGCGEDGLVLLGAGRIFERCGDRESAVGCYNHCRASENHTVRQYSMGYLAQIYKKSGEYARAAEQLEALLAGAKAPNIPVMIELSKHYEHRLKDLSKARALVRRALNLCFGQNFLRNMYYTDLKFRLERLERKLGKKLLPTMND